MSGHKRQLALSPIDAADPVVGRYLAMLADTRRRTLAVLEDISEKVAAWVSPDGVNINSVLYHLAAIEVSWLYTDVLVSQPWTPELKAMFVYPVREDGIHITLIEADTFDQHRERLSRMHQIVMEVYQAMSLDDFRRPRQLDDYDVTPEWVIHHLMQHEAEHRSTIDALKQVAFNLLE